MKKKKLRSSRNRHTGRINAYKEAIIKAGKTVVARDRTAYKVIATTELINNESIQTAIIRKTQIVRAGI